jgi:hypothetical protein
VAVLTAVWATDVISEEAVLKKRMVNSCEWSKKHDWQGR